MKQLESVGSTQEDRIDISNPLPIFHGSKFCALHISKITSWRMNQMQLMYTVYASSARRDAKPWSFARDIFAWSNSYAPEIQIMRITPSLFEN